MAEEKAVGCFMCTNAHTDPELTSNDDLSYITIGNSLPKKRMMFRTGDGRTTQIITEEFNEESGCWQLVGFYRPNFCPHCGRELIENRKGCSRDFR